VPSDFTLKTMNTIHRGVLKITGGHFGWKAGVMPVVELTTIGRKSGEPRTVLLTSPLQEDDRWVIVASRGGDPHHPAWFLNLRDRPEVEARLGGKPKQKMHARIATPEEREELWPRVTKVYKGYANYQTKTDREIPLVFLESTG
jgi:deazaflavin-dependent oxidoreductase (nitroreductase family)